ncbi:MAG TPA: transglycosylase domain-containing protein, partial [Actinomycetota bacterium]|nr:transglycosylase domain-containing protein [Actinomycetota bacterium]
KLKEAYLAYQLEQQMSKDEILTRYLNTVYFGNGAYGIQAAAETYFDRPAGRLNLNQAALLAGLIQAPNDFDPVAHPRAARQRRTEVLANMRDLGMITDAAYQRASAHPVNLRLQLGRQQHYLAPYFVDYFKQWFLSNPRFGKTVEDRYNLLFEGGLRIQTTLVPRLQRQAETAVRSILTYRRDPYGAMTVLDPRTGYIKAMVGGRDYWSPSDRYARINLAAGGTTGRQAGSAFKPFALVAALEDGLPPSTRLNGSSARIPLQNGTYWEPGNAEGGGYGTISLETATVNSVNIAYANLLEKMGGGDAYVGARQMVQVAKRMGIRCCTRTTSPRTPLQAVPSAVLGTNEVNTVEMASAYGTLAYGGQHVQPTPVIRIVAPDGKVLYQANPKPRRVVPPAVITVADGILQKVVLYGTGAAANLGRPQIGKTGTAQNYSDAWFVGAIPQLVAAVWVGFPQGQISMAYPRVRISRVYGGTWPAQIWRAFMVNATKHIPAKAFPSSNVTYVTVRVDVTQGCLANPYTPPANIQTIQYISGTEPQRICKEPRSYQFLAVPSVIGLKENQALATLQAAGFNITSQYRGSDQPVGTVIAQDPAAGQQAQQTSTVTITVAKNPAPSPSPQQAIVPDVIGMSRSDAVAALQDAGFAVTVVKDHQCSPSDPGCHEQKGVVWSQDPSGGEQAREGTTVTIVVSP